MRSLTEEERNIFLEKLSKYIGDNVAHFTDPPGKKHHFQLHKDRVYYVSEDVLKQAESISRDNLVCFGTCFGKFTKTKKFRLHVTCLNHLTAHAKYKIWVKPSAEQQFLYGHHILKSGLARITDNTPKYQGVIIYSLNDIPLGFGVAAKSTADCRNADPLTIICFHQADIGEYIRNEESLI